MEGLILLLIILGVLAVVALVLFLVLKKDVVLTIEGDVFVVKTKGACLYVFLNEHEFNVPNPMLFKGEELIAGIGDKRYKVRVKSNYFGNKLFVKIYDMEGNLLATNVRNDK